jgi:DNA primase catalytic core
LLPKLEKGNKLQLITKTVKKMDIQEAIAHIKTLPIADYISKTVDLKRVGIHLKGLCPFHNEKTPSFIVYPETNTYCCFGCQEKGDIISFAQKIENLDFVDTIKHLSQEAGIDIEFKKYNKNNSTHKDNLVIENVLSKASNIYHNALLENDDAIDYLVNKRKLTLALIKHFKLGLAKDFNCLKKNLTTEEIEIGKNLGIVKNNRTGGIRDFFINRITFPIQKENNAYIGMGGRIYLENNNQPKYLNTNESVLFSKRKVLYGINHAYQSIVKNRKILIVEGYLDVIKLHQVGIDYAIGILGTAITKEHLNVLSKLLRYENMDVYLSLDNDNAGKKAIAQSINLLVENKLVNNNIFVVISEHGKDWDEILVKNNHSIKPYQLALKNKQPCMDWLINYYFTIEANKNIALGKITQCLTIAKSNVPISGYIHRIAENLSNTTKQYNTIYTEVENSILQSSKPTLKKELLNNKDKGIKSKSIPEITLLELLCYFPWVRFPVSVIIKKYNIFMPIACQDIYNQIIFVPNIVSIDILEELDNKKEHQWLILKDLTEPLIFDLVVNLLIKVKTNHINYLTKYLISLLEQSTNTKDNRLIELLDIKKKELNAFVELVEKDFRLYR